MIGDYSNKKNPVAAFEFSDDENLLCLKAEDPLAAASGKLSKKRVYAPPPVLKQEACNSMFPLFPAKEPYSVMVCFLSADYSSESRVASPQ